MQRYSNGYVTCSCCFFLFFGNISISKILKIYSTWYFSCNFYKGNRNTSKRGFFFRYDKLDISFRCDELTLDKVNRNTQKQTQKSFTRNLYVLFLSPKNSNYFGSLLLHFSILKKNSQICGFCFAHFFQRRKKPRVSNVSEKVS